MLKKILPTPSNSKFKTPGRGGRGRQSDGFGLGPGGECVCPSCGTKVPHQRGVPCYKHRCSKCDQAMTR